ncbi:hypothetical protein DLREEDagrD3_06220 [Denitratisoma sp. agr-D3]
MQTDPSAATAQRVPRDYCWLSTAELKPGMVVARPLFASAGMKATIHLAVGSTITAGTIDQIISKGVECVAVRLDTPPDATTLADLASRHAARLGEIFGPAPDEHCRPLLAALLEDGPSLC